MKEKMHTGDLYLPNDPEIATEQQEPQLAIQFLPELREKVYQYNMPVHIGRNCWIGANVTILPGVSIGDNTVIGAGSVVTKDIPSNVVAVGVPCKVLRNISEHDKDYYFRDYKIKWDEIK